MKQVILSDENCTGHAKAIFHTLQYLDFVELLGLTLKTFADIDLDYGADDETVWRFCQEREYLLLTGNRTTKDGAMSLELVIRRLITPNNLPILTIGNMDRVLVDRDYRQRCAEKLAEIVFDIDLYRGVSRIYL
ncbi:hypothetical protein QUF58_03110 [Anaerolineales bacterium HSG24]|nr:hypothetical protein [Anaerolineales bacterium HSG24]